MKGNYFNTRHGSNFSYHPPEFMRVAIMPRGPRRDNARRDYPHHRFGMAYDSYLPMRYGTHFDIYYRPDHTAMWKHDDKLRTNHKRIVLQHALTKLDRGEYVGDIKWGS